MKIAGSLPIDMPTDKRDVSGLAYTYKVNVKHRNCYLDKTKGSHLIASFIDNEFVCKTIS